MTQKAHTRKQTYTKNIYTFLSLSLSDTEERLLKTKITHYHKERNTQLHTDTFITNRHTSSSSSANTETVKKKNHTHTHSHKNTVGTRTQERTRPRKNLEHTVGKKDTIVVEAKTVLHTSPRVMPPGASNSFISWRTTQPVRLPFPKRFIWLYTREWRKCLSFFFVLSVKAIGSSFVFFFFSLGEEMNQFVFWSESIHSVWNLTTNSLSLFFQVKKSLGSSFVSKRSIWSETRHSLFFIKWRNRLVFPKRSIWSETGLNLFFFSLDMNLHSHCCYNCIQRLHTYTNIYTNVSVFNNDSFQDSKSNLENQTKSRKPSY